MTFALAWRWLERRHKFPREPLTERLLPRPITAWRGTAHRARRWTRAPNSVRRWARKLVPLVLISIFRPASRRWREKSRRARNGPPIPAMPVVDRAIENQGPGLFQWNQPGK